jgi:hypothetical protein
MPEDANLKVEPPPDSASDTFVQTPSVITREHISRFQRRYRLHFLTSLIILLLILSLTGFAIYIFLFPQDIDRPTGSIEALLQLQTALRGQEAILKSAGVELDGEKQEALVGSRTVSDVLISLDFYERALTKRMLLQAKEKLLIESGYFSDLDSTITKEEVDAERQGMNDYLSALLQLQKETQDRYKLGELTRTDIAAVEARVEAAKTQIDFLSQRSETALPAAIIRSKRTNLDTLALVSTSLVRFGGVTVILFLTSILVPIYRHNVRLASFYLARADSLILSRDARVDDFSQLTNLLTPTISFDKEPRTPFEGVSTLVKDAGKLTKGI